MLVSGGNRPDLFFYASLHLTIGRIIASTSKFFADLSITYAQIGISYAVRSTTCAHIGTTYAVTSTTCAQIGTSYAVTSTTCAHIGIWVFSRFP